MFKNESNISDFAFLVFLTAPIWIVLLMGYEFFKNLRDIIIYCAWGGAYIYGLCIGAILGYVFLKDNVVLAVITFFSSNIIFILNFMQETSEYQNLYTLGKIFFEMNIFFLFVTLLSDILEKHDCKKIVRILLATILPFVLIICFFQYSYQRRVQSIKECYTENSREIILRQKPVYKNSINFNIEKRDFADYEFIPLGRKIDVGERVRLSNETITKNDKEYALIFTDKAYGYVLVRDGEKYIKGYQAFSYMW